VPESEELAVGVPARVVFALGHYWPDGTRVALTRLLLASKFPGPKLLSVLPELEAAD
jgi:hypothetical protein